MTASERIREILEQRKIEEKRANRERKVQAKEAREYQARVANEARKRELEIQNTERARTESARQIQRDRLNSLIERSNIKDELDRIAKDHLRLIKHDVVVNYDDSFVQLVWGKYHLGKNGEIDSNWRNIKDYSYVRIDFDISSEHIRIQNKKIKKEEWKTNPVILEDALTQAYLSPIRVLEPKRKTPTEPPSYSTGRTEECCCT